MNLKLTCFGLIILLTKTLAAQSTIIKYMDFTAPIDSAILFAPGLISTFMNDRDITISADRNEIYFSVHEGPNYVLVGIQKKNGKWQNQKVLHFCGQYSDVEPVLSADGKRLYFASNRPLQTGDPKKDFDIWYVDKTDSGWSDPANMGSPVNSDKHEFYPSIAKSGNMYFTSHDNHIYVSKFDGEKYLEPELLPDSVNTKVGEYNAFVDPEERYILYSTHGVADKIGRGDIYITFKKEENSWTTPKLIRNNVSTPAYEMCPFVTADGKYLFFSSDRKGENPEPVQSYQDLEKLAKKPQNGKFDIYWISTSVFY